MCPNCFPGELPAGDGQLTTHTGYADGETQNPNMYISTAVKWLNNL